MKRISARRDFYSLTELAKRLKISPGDALFMCRQGFFPNYSHPTLAPDSWSIPLKDVETFLENHEDWRTSDDPNKFTSKTLPWEGSSGEFP